MITFITSLEGEDWKEISDAPGYWASSLGRIASDTTVRFGGCVLKQAFNKTTKRYQVSIPCGGKYKTKPVHRLICSTFHGASPSKKHHAAHWDGNALNNCATNLRWATPKENEEDKKRHGRTVCGEKSIHACLVEADILQIRKMRNEGVENSVIASAFGISISHVIDIGMGKNWNHLPFSNTPKSKKGERNSNASLTENDVRQIRSLLKAHTTGPVSHTVEKICEKFNIGPSGVYAIKYGRKWQHIL